MKQPTKPSPLVTSESVEYKKFTARRAMFSPERFGYDEDEVDDFLDEVVATLRYYEDMMWQQKKD